MSIKTTLILGIGNTLLSDEGAGVHVIRYLLQRYPAQPGVTYLDGGTLSFILAPSMEGADNLIVVDAAQLGTAPGNWAVFIGSEMDLFLGSVKRSVHEVGLIDLLNISRLTGSLPKQRALVGIQPAQLGWGEHLSPCVAATVPKAAAKIMQLAKTWHKQSLSYEQP